MAATEQDARYLALAGAKYASARADFSTRGIRLTDAEVEAIMDGFEKEDDKEKTWTRRMVENYLSKYRWYFPRKDIEGSPSLSKAWAYYEHVTLPRHFTGENSAGNILRRAEPGEQRETNLYKPLSTSHANLIEFGIGIDLYFQTCAMLCLMFFLASLVNITNIHYYAEKYSGEKSRGWALEGSAVCTQTYWAICEDCTEDQFRGEAGVRYATTSNGTVLVERNDCDIGLEQGIVNYVTWIFFFLFLSGISMYLRARESRFETDTLTACDYSVLIKNPPPDAMDPEEWRDFFNQFAEKQVTLISIHLNNEVMLRKLALRRIYRDNLRRLLPKGTDLDDEDVVRTAVDVHVRQRDAEPKGCISVILDCTVFPVLRLLGMFLKAETLVDRVFDLKSEIEKLQKQRYSVSKVYITFETEEGQRAALTALAASKIDIIMNNTHTSAATFHGRVLDAVEPTEPTAVRWLDLSDTKMYRVMAFSLTLCLTLGLIALAAFLEDLTRRELGPGYSGPVVSVFNSIIPILVKIMMIFERHPTEGSFQSSLYLKVTLFRWVNTAVVLQSITPLTRTIGNTSEDLLPSVSAILWSELFIAPALRLLDIGSSIQKHVLAPRASTQEQANRYFLGTPYNLGERYTDLTKVMFVCFFYSALFPASFAFGFAILLVQYFTDKFCLLRVWGQAPALGRNLAVYSRRYFFTGALVAFVIASAYAFAQFPYDNICDPVGGEITRIEIIVANVTRLRSETGGPTKPEDVILGQVEPVHFCAQGFRDQDGFNFPPRVESQPNGLRWMTDIQETIVNMYGVTVIIAVVVFFTGAFLGTAVKQTWSFFRSHYEPKGASQRIDFSCNPEIAAYIPHVKLRTYPFPFLAANVDDLDASLLGFTDSHHTVDYHNMLFDIPFSGLHRSKRERSPDGQEVNTDTEEQLHQSLQQATSSERPIFGIVKWYKPDWWETSPR